METWEREGQDLFLLGGAELRDPILLSLAFGSLFVFGSLEEGENSEVEKKKGGQTSFFSLLSSSFISFSTSSRTFLIFAFVSGRKTTFPVANRSTSEKTASTRGMMSSACSGMLMSRRTRLEACFWAT